MTKPTLAALRRQAITAACAIIAVMLGAFVLHFSGWI
jgi:hypothetical protein